MRTTCLGYDCQSHDHENRQDEQYCSKPFTHNKTGHGWRLPEFSANNQLYKPPPAKRINESPPRRLYIRGHQRWRLSAVKSIAARRRRGRAAVELTLLIIGTRPVVNLVTPSHVPEHDLAYKATTLPPKKATAVTAAHTLLIFCFIP